VIETVLVPSQHMLYITTRTSDRASSIASTIKLSLDQVLRFMDESGISPTGSPMAVFSDWNGHLVTVEAGYPVASEVNSLPISGRIQSGRTPDGPAARCVYRNALADYARQHEDFAAGLRASGLRMTGTTWEIYSRDPDGGWGETTLYAQLLAPETGVSPAG
jgi:hypothetical protein